MKTGALLKVSAIFFSCTTIYAQNEIKTINLDFENKQINQNEINSINKGDYYRLKINNINMNLYQVSLQNKDSVEISNITFPTLELLRIDDITKIAAGIVTSTSSLSQLKEIRDQITIVNSKLFALDLEEQKLTKKNLSLDQNLKNLNKSMNQSMEIIDNVKEKAKLDSLIKWNSSQINSNKILIENLSKELTKLYEDYDKESKKVKENQLIIQIVKIKSDIKQTLDKSKPLVSEVNKLLTSLRLKKLTYLESTGRSFNSTTFGFSDQLAYDQVVELTVFLEEECKKLISELNKHNASMDSLKSIHKDEFEKNESIKKEFADYSKTYSDAKSALEKESVKIDLNKVVEFLEVLIHLENNSTRKYTSLPIQRTADLSELKITITPKKQEYGQSYSAVYTFPLKRSYAGISGGFYYANSFRNDVYSSQEIKTSDTTSNFYLINENEKRGELGFTTLLHIGTKLKIDNSNKIQNLFGIHATIGPAISLNATPQMRLATGFGLSLGRKHSMLTIDALGMMGYVKRKSNAFNESTAYLSQPQNPTISKLSSSFAISLGYIYRF